MKDNVKKSKLFYLFDIFSSSNVLIIYILFKIYHDSLLMKFNYHPFYIYACLMT